ncbi:Hypothetical protein IALB_0606 [Ignavibacterium album JCM 16511]|uniref:DUF2911 domain-containing protein n=1 Tax=Ignavibacterium album (strain DSM 19864 / JCM 16511 / NBRC 101810 / Mat9-16) TaxID=945713 RepID=I0AH61_IGNAJ|nr:DUF2911 domain-containing protein [Ignavibacterium album]AFH48318.1 Hypothetical protein IALB_0606 [Ignavibacterium album JCM 16511]
MNKTLFALILSLISFATLAQNKEEKVRVSPKAEVMQVVGFTEVRIIYSRPGVKGREIWGGLVPYNQVWRAGANEATKFIFSTDVVIEGKPLKAGSYSFFAIPGKNEWTLIFNKVADQWGAFEYNEAQDALRIKVKPEKSSVFQEWLTYSITRTSDYSAVITLEWEKLKIPFKIEVK